MVYLLGLLAAFSFALGLTLQQRGTLETSAPEGDPHFLAEIIRKPVWLIGGLLVTAGWILQAAALNYGSLILVQSLMALSLVFALPLGVRLTGQHVGRRSIIGAGTTLLGIILLVAIGQPQGGISEPGATAWWTAGLVVVGLVIVLVLLARRRRGAVAAALFAAAAGTCFGFQAAVTKVFVSDLGNGLGAIFSSWPVYVLVLSALSGFVLQQSSLKTGFLAPAMAALNAVTLAISVILGVTVFQESLSHGEGRLSPAIIGLVIAVIGVLLLSTPEPKPVEGAKV
jgi:drug/metabolite transporter (DMT)-like permease